MPYQEKALLTIFGLCWSGVLVTTLTGSLAITKSCNEADIQAYFDKMLVGRTSEREVAFATFLRCGEQSVPVLVEKLGNDERMMREEAITVLRRLVVQSEDWSSLITAAAVEDLITQLQSDAAFAQRESAAEALGVIMPKLPESLVQQGINSLTQALETPENPTNVRIAAVRSLGQADEVSSRTIALLAKQLQDNQQVEDVRAEISLTLAQIGGQEAIAVLLATFQSDLEPSLKGDIVQALGNLKQTSPAVIENLVKAIQYDTIQVSIAASSSLRQLVETSPKKEVDRITTSHLEALVKALGNDNDEVLNNLVGILKQVSAQLLQGLDLSSKALTAYRTQLRAGLTTLEHNPNARPEDVQDLRQAVHSLDSSNRQIILLLKELLKNSAITWMIHALIWLGLIFVYPKSPQVQAIFFWNPKIRQILGLGYVSLALTWIPFLRSKLFAPFKSALVADADLENFEGQAYFPDLIVVLKGQSSAQPIHQAVPEIQGQIVLEGESGLGKTMFLRHRVKTSSRIGVYLLAKKCTAGVMEAIQAKLHGPAQDPNFLQSLIYSGAVDIYIDGLNEVTPDTRAKITLFVENYFQGNIVMTTQPLEWIPPSTARTYVLQPLTRERIEQFLISRQFMLPVDVAIQGAAYPQACRDYLASTLDSQRSEEEIVAMRQILSNPMDLTIVAQMIAEGKTPDLLNLRQQEYEIMATDYRKTNLNQPFPLAEFAEMTYQMRLENTIAIPAEPLFKELRCLERYRMVLSRRLKNAKNELTTEWYFRHEKIQDFFIVQTFLGAENERPHQHISDPRFRGVYLLLATLLPLDAAQHLREILIQYAAKTQDHTISDRFIQLLQSRQTS